MLQATHPSEWLFKDGCKLQFVCEGCRKLAVCGEGGDGYLLDEARGWVKTCAPVLLFSMRLIKFASKAAAVPLPDLGDGALNDALDGIAGALSALGGGDDEGEQDAGAAAAAAAPSPAAGAGEASAAASDEALHKFVLANYASSAMDAAMGALQNMTDAGEPGIAQQDVARKGMPLGTTNISMRIHARPTPHTSVGHQAGIVRHLRPAPQSHHKRGAFT